MVSSLKFYITHHIVYSTDFSFAGVENGGGGMLVYLGCSCASLILLATYILYSSMLGSGVTAASIDESTLQLDM